MILNAFVYLLFIWSMGKAYETTLIMAQHLQKNYKCVLLLVIMSIAAITSIFTGSMISDLPPVMTAGIAHLMGCTIQKNMKQWHYSHYPVTDGSQERRTIITLVLLVLFSYISVVYKIYPPVTIIYLASKAWHTARYWIMDAAVRNSSGRYYQNISRNSF